MEERAKQRIFILGSGGRLGAALMKEWKELDHLKLVALSRKELDFSQPEAPLEVFKNTNSLKKILLLIALR